MAGQNACLTYIAWYNVVQAYENGEICVDPASSNVKRDHCYRVRPHWRMAKTKLIPDPAGVKWGPRMQQVTIDNIYASYKHVQVMFYHMQRIGIKTLGDT